MQTNHQFNLQPWKRAFGLGLQLYCFLFCFVAAGVAELTRTYDYKGFDTNGNIVVAGVITLRVDDTIQVKGNWQLKILDRNKLKELGPQDGSGKFVGQLKDDRIFLNLNPDQYENNIFLEGKVTKANIFKINGKWGLYGFVGKLNEGTFEMTRKQEPSKEHP